MNLKNVAENILSNITEIFKPVKTNEKFVRVKIQRNQDLLKYLFENVIKDDGFICGGFGRVSVSKNSDPIPSGDIDIYSYEQFK